MAFTKLIKLIKQIDESDLTDLTGRAQRLLGQLQDMVRTLKTSPLELTLVLAALVAILLAAGGNHLPDAITNSFDSILTPILGEPNWTRVKGWLPATLTTLAGLLIAWTLRRLWKKGPGPNPLPDGPVQATAIKGPLAFTEQDGELFRRLGRETELARLVGWLEDDQTGLAVVMGESGAGKTSLLRAGLSQVLQDRGVGFLYWEALPDAPEAGLLKAAQARWQAARYPAAPQSLDDLLILPAGTERRIIVLDQFEQLQPERPEHQPIFELLRRIAQERTLPYRTTWLVAFREEYAAAWWRFQARHGIQPPMLFVERFHPRQAGAVIATLAEEAEIQLGQDLVGTMVRDMSADDRVSPVDIGIGMMMLDELARGRPDPRLTRDDYLRAGGGAEGLLTGYITSRLKWFPAAHREHLLKAMLALVDPDHDQRIAEGRTVSDLGAVAGLSQETLAVDLDYLASPNLRLLEKLSPTAEEKPPGYRLPHERMIPALRRLSGAILAQAEQARRVLETAYRAWRNNDKIPRYLLAGRELRRVVRHARDFHWGRDQQEKRRFLGLSRRRRRRVYGGLAVAGLALLLTAGAGWQWNRRLQHADDLERWKLPTDLYRYHHQLETLILDSGYLTHLRWLEQDALRRLMGLMPAALRGRTRPDRSLQTLRIYAPLTELPDLPDTLVTLDLAKTGLAGLHGLPGALPGLQSLALAGNDGLTSLQGLPGDLPGLQSLTLTGTDITSLQGLPGDLSGLQSLTLRINHRLTSLQGLPAKLPALQSLTLRINHRLTSLQGLPGDLPALQSLTLADNYSLTSLRSLPGALPALQSLTLKNNNRLTSLQGLPGDLSALQSLTLAYNKGLTSLQGLPDDLPGLQSLTLAGNDGLTFLRGLPGDLPALQSLTLKRNEDLTSLQGLPGDLPGLQSLTLERNENLTSLQGLPDALPALQSLTLRHNDRLTSLQDLPGELSALQSLTLADNDDLTSLQGLPSELSALQSLTLGWNDGLTSLQDLPGDLSALQSLPLKRNTSLTSLQGLPDDLPALQSLTLNNNASLTSLQGLPDALPALQSLTLNNNASLTSLQGLPGDLPGLQSLSLAGNGGLTSLTGWPQLPELKSLDLRHTGIEDIRGLDHICPNLTTLDIRSTQVRSLEGLPASVTTLYVGDRTSYKRPEDQ